MLRLAMLAVAGVGFAVVAWHFLLPERWSATSEEASTSEVPKPRWTQCDLLASAPDDFGRPAGLAGVEVDEIDVGKARDACAAELAERPGEPRLAYQMARVLMASGEDDEAAGLVRRAAAAGHPRALTELGLLSRSSDPAKAVAFFAYAAGLGDGEGMFRFAEALLYGVGVSRDPEEALFWYERAEERGHRGAVARLETSRGLAAARSAARQAERLED